jgi:hypothetical protein
MRMPEDGSSKQVCDGERYTKSAVMARERAFSLAATAEAQALPSLDGRVRQGDSRELDNGLQSSETWDARVVDAHGVTVPSAANCLHFAVEGAGTLVARQRIICRSYAVPLSRSCRAGWRGGRAGAGCRFRPIPRHRHGGGIGGRRHRPAGDEMIADHAASALI